MQINFFEEIFLFIFQPWLAAHRRHKIYTICHLDCKTLLPRAVNRRKSQRMSNLTRSTLINPTLISTLMVTKSALRTCSRNRSVDEVCRFKRKYTVFSSFIERRRKRWNMGKVLGKVSKNRKWSYAKTNVP